MTGDIEIKFSDVINKKWRYFFGSCDDKSEKIPIILNIIKAVRLQKK